MRILTAAGAHPSLMKAAPLVREMRRYPTIVPVLVHPGRHYDEVIRLTAHV